MPNQLPASGIFAYVGRRFAVLATVAWALGVWGLDHSDVGDFITSRLARPIEFRVRHALGKSPELSPNIKIFSLDDSTYAKIKKPYLTGAMWAELFEGIARSHPTAILTNHMFGTGEFDDDGGRLIETLRRLRKGQIQITAGAFAYPGQIAYRDPLPLDRDEFHTFMIDSGGGIGGRASATVPFVDRMGWRLYGPERDYASLFSRLGHVAYDGKGRVPAVLRLAPDRVVPHLAFNAAAETQYSILGIHVDKERLPVISTGELWVNMAPMEVYSQRAKSLKALFRDIEGGGFSRYIEPGDTVLILTDMYTGKVSFVPTPVGPVPGGYVVTAMLNSVLTRQWIRDVEIDPVLIALSAIAGAGLALFAASWGFWTLLASGTLISIGASLAAFSYAGVFLPWIPTTLAFLGTSLTLFGRKLQGRLREEGDKSRQAEREAAKLSAIVRTAQMFAHDVRKPFSMLNMALQTIQREKDPKRIAQIFDRLFPELKRAMGSVEGMIQDIMEIDSNAELRRQETSILDLLKVSLYEVFALRKDNAIKLKYRFRHTCKVDVDFNRVRRVIVNILDNAVQAMEGRGTIWIRTQDVIRDQKAFVEIVIGNDNSVIPAEILPKIFEAFFTKGKKAGTGLGLAIAHKVVTDHGGEISCHSGEEQGTEFCFTLPVAHATPEPTAEASHLPEHGKDFASPRWAEALRDDEDKDEPDEETRQETRLARLATAIGRPLDILVVDDEQICLDSLIAQLTMNGNDQPLRVRTAENADQALAACAEREPDAIYCDIDLGPKSLDGFELVEELRHRGVTSAILIHSNRVMPRDSRKAAEVGADTFLPKPASRVQLLKVLASTIEERLPGVTIVEEEPIVAIVDDSPFTLDAWASLVTDCRLVPFLGPLDFLERLEREPHFLSSLSCVIVDYYFEQDDRTGIDLARIIKSLSHVPVLLSSDGAVLRADEEALIDGHLGKEPLPFASIRARLQKAG